MKLVRCPDCKVVFACSIGGKANFCVKCELSCENKQKRVEDYELKEPAISFKCPVHYGSRK